MPLVLINKMTDVWDDALDRLEESIKRIVAHVLKIEPSGVTVVFVKDVRGQIICDELVAEVRGIYAYPGRTPDVITLLQEEISTELMAFARAYLPECMKAETLRPVMDSPNSAVVAER